MKTTYGFAFNYGSKEFTLICTLEDPGVQPRFTLAVTNGSSSWTANSIDGRPTERGGRWEDTVCEALQGKGAYVFRLLDEPPTLFIDRAGQRDSVNLQPSQRPVSTAEAYAFQHSLSLTHTIARQQDALAEKERQASVTDRELVAVKAQLTQYVEGQAKHDKELTATLKELLNSKKKQLQQMADKLRDVQQVPDEDEEEPRTDDDPGCGSERGSQQKPESAQRGMLSASTVRSESAGGSAVASAAGAADGAGELDPGAIQSAATQDLQEQHIADEDMPDVFALPRSAAAAASAEAGASGEADALAAEATAPAEGLPDRPRALAKRRKRAA
ncbi:hypothetical protein WJX81_008354 [Elliptochloris bilobata]|uniref:Uncharacterized protein n=1 Tax=Elliptochloris bilobata TaxID=381761 RepID=A0AAW1S4B1_9CHLO